MRQPVIRAALAAGALVALSLPVLGGTKTAAACTGETNSAGFCVTASSPINGFFDTYVSPPTVTAPALTLGERATSSQPTSAAQNPTINGNVSFTINDLTDNSQGLVAVLQAGNFTSPTYNPALVFVPPSQVMVQGTPSVTGVCVSSTASDCGAAIPLGTNHFLGRNDFGAGGTAVAAECPSIHRAEQQIAVSVPLQLRPTGLAAEKIATQAASYYVQMSVALVAGLSPSDFATIGSTYAGPSNCSLPAGYPNF